MPGKVLVDTSVWISFFREADSSIALQLKQLLRTGAPAYTGIIATELYRGAKSKKETVVIDELLSSIEQIETREKDFIAAGALGFELSRHGINVGTIDLLIANIAIANKARLFTLDTHFKSIARHSPLQLFN